MTLLEMSEVYACSARTLHRRITLLRAQARQSPDRSAASAARRRIAALMPLWQEARELTALTAHYYDRRIRHEIRQP